MLPWIQAWRPAAAEFYRREQPAAHFSTAAQAPAPLADALAHLLLAAVEDLDEQRRIDVVDVGGGGGELLRAVAERVRELDHALASRCRFTVVELRPRPNDLAAGIDWIVGAAPESVEHHLHGLLIAHELLDDVPLDVVQRIDDGSFRTVLVDPATGAESLGTQATTSTLEWIERWWPDAQPGDRVEVGVARDAMWAALTERLDRGLAVAVDYAHARDERSAGRWSSGSLTGYRDGRVRAPVPDGSTNLTAHVALDACLAAAAERAADRGVVSQSALLDQRAMLAAFGTAPSVGAPGASPQDRLEAIARGSVHAQAADPHGFGSFTWLVQSFGIALPTSTP